ncbi:MAG TPA: sigma-54 dependent transcriptional regulator [Pyrinomonadaceae bacterium]|nr:sigma-54 dependent transcriptional regulator [Pyrinomonadaceae bacterium]
MTHDIVEILTDGFQPTELDQIVEALESSGHRCLLRDGVSEMGATVSTVKTELLLAASATNETSSLIESIKSCCPDRYDVPLLVYLLQSGPVGMEGALRTEIDDFLLAPLNLDDLLLRVNRLTGRCNRRRRELEDARQGLFLHFAAQEFIGSAPAFLAAVEKIPVVASCDATVLLVGATGTGKELCARAIHYLSSRAQKPFVPLNCGSIPSELFENELFGHESGAYTDARHSRRGLISEAEGGTLFLDEVDSLALSAQVKLLRFLQDRQYRPLGGQYRRADVRVIAATNHNLHAQMKAGTFREDLFYRLKVVSLNLPDLRDRREDIVPLALHFLKLSAEEYKRPAKELSTGAIQKLSSYQWPGNVRELENVIRQAVVLARGPVIRAGDLELTVDAETSKPVGESLKASKAHMIEEFERSYLEEMLAACSGNISKAARLAGKDRRTFFGLLKKYDLTPKQSMA